MVIVVVPDKYSNTPPEQRPHTAYDIRSVIVGTATGVNDVRKWFAKIAENLVQSTQEQMPVESAQSKLEKQGGQGPMQPPAMPQQ